MNNTSQPAYKVLRLPAVKDMTGLSRTSLYDRMAEGTFPKNFCLGGKAVGWNYSDVQGWIKQQIDNAQTITNTK